MKSMHKITGIVCLLAVSSLLCAPDIVDQTTKKLLPTMPIVQSIFTTMVEEKQAKRTELEQELAKLKEKEKQSNDTINEALENLKGDVDAVKEQLRRHPNNDFLLKKLALLNDHYQGLKDRKNLYEKLIATLEKNIKLHDSYLTDPQFKHVDKDLGLDEQKTVTLEHFQEISRRIQEQEKIIAQLNEQKKNVQLELENRKQDIALQISQRKKKIEEPGVFELNIRQQEELNTLDTKLEQDKRALFDIRKREVEQRKELIKTEIFLAENLLERYRSALKIIKPRIKVPEATIAYARDELAKRRQLFFDAQEAYDQRIEMVVQRQKEIKSALDSLLEQTSITLGPDVDDWSREPASTAQGYFELFEVASLNTSILLLQRQREFIEAQRVLGDRILKEEAVDLDIKGTFQRLITHRLTTDEIVQEKKKYEALKARAKADEVSLTTQKGEAEVHLERQKKAAMHIANKRQVLRSQRSTIFKQRMQEYTRCLELLNDAEAKIKRQIDLVMKVMSTYEDSVGLVHKTLKHIDFITAELDAEIMWGRSAHAVSWEGIKSAWSDAIAFGRDLRTYIAGVRIASIADWFNIHIHSIFDMVLHLVVLVILSLGFIAIRYCIRFVLPFLRRTNQRQPMLYAVSMVTLLFGEYINRYFVYLAAWVLVLCMLTIYVVHDPYPFAFFYLCSIPYALFLIRCLVHHIAEFNSLHNYIFLSPTIQQHVLTIVRLLLYLSCIMLFFREAFLAISHYDSELPAILLALNVILFQISLIFLLAKIIEQFVSAFAAKNERLSWLRSVLDRYYYFVLTLCTAVMIMSNPSVGFGNLVLYVLGRVLLTALVIIVLSLIHRLLKSLSSYVFFYSENALVRERFAHAKSWYGLFVILIFLTFISLGAIFIAKVWGWPEQFASISRWSDIVAWLRTPIMFEKTADVPISVFSILQVFGFVLAGVVVSLTINRIVLEKIFDVLMVDSGAQNAISSIASYLIVALATIFGFQAVGRGDLVVWVLGALVLGLGWVVKDPLGDFIAYFIILVQRPVKIGDYIRLDDSIMGVVRRITPRAVVVRRKNSTMIIIPNMTIITKPLINWNYQRGFIAFEDILVRVSFKEDPNLVKTILERVLDENSFVLKSPRAVVRLEEFTEYGFLFLARGYISVNYTLDQWDIASDVRLAIVRELRAQGIQLAMSTRILLDRDSARLIEESQTPTAKGQGSNSN